MPQIPSLARSAVLAAAALALAAPLAAQQRPPVPDPREVSERDVRAELTALAHDSMAGRGTATEGEMRAARYISGMFARFGVEAAGDSGYLQRVPLVVQRRGARDGLRLATPADTGPEVRRKQAYNVVAVVRGSDPVLRDEAVLVGAHYDHLGVGEPTGGDSIFNGADDDASGVVAVMEIARALAKGPAPKRTVVLIAFTGEEVGLLGTRWYIDHPVVPIERTVANLQIEMIGRADSIAGGRGRGWLTGYERSSMGPMLADAGVPIVPDPRPEFNFFERSDNIAFARLGIPAHTLSSYNLHEYYHTVDDESDRIEYAHMTRVIEAAVNAVRTLANGPAPAWVPGGRPAAPGAPAPSSSAPSPDAESHPALSTFP
jgi:hypothetical protein